MAGGLTPILRMALIILDTSEGFDIIFSTWRRARFVLQGYLARKKHPPP